MITTDMRLYTYFTIGAKDKYGQPQISEEPQGTIKMAINTTSQATQENIRYKDATYLGLTYQEVNDTYVIDYNGERLKVLYVQPKGRYKQVFMKNI